MAIVMIEGFEHIDPSAQLTAEQIEYLFLGRTPDITDDWFAEGSVEHISGGGRIANNCLRFIRPSGTGTWKDKFGANIAFSFTPKQRVILGFAVKYSVVPTVSIPIVRFSYDNGSDEDEQLSLWASPTGALYLSATAYNAEYALQGAPATIPAGTTAASTMRFTNWTYLELVADYSGDTPTVSIFVNGSLVLDAAESVLFRKMDEDYISSISIINPTNAQFGGAAFNQDIDDLYVSDNAILGPQQIIPMFSDTMVASTGWTVNPPDQYQDGDAVAESPGVTGQERVFELTDVPAGIGTPNAVGVHVIVSVDVGLDGIQFGFESSTGTEVKKHGTTSEDAPDRCLRFVRESMPNGSALTEAGVNSLRGLIEAADVIA